MNRKNSIGSPKHISLDHICDLLSITTTQDALGQFIRTEESTTVFCSELSITRAEFNTAGQLGHKPDILLIVDGESYSQEQYIEYEKIKYTIYKTFRRADGFTELYCEIRGGD
jgi:SPP1 family predicted phage head-tail adaptor